MIDNALHQVADARARASINAALGVICALAVLIAGCSSGGGGSSSAPGSMRSEGAAVFGVGPAAGSPGSAAAARPAAWRIVLATYSGENALAQAQAALPIFQNEGGVPEAFVEARRRGAVIALGAYESPSSSAAQRDLARIRAITYNDRPAHPAAFLAPPESRSLGGDPELDLATARERYGQSVKYTLQVAVYESDRRAEAARLAEQAAAAYRADGELAFYFHGPNRSMVTIGLFTDRDYDPQNDRVSAELRALIARHPKHLLNGMGVRERGPDGTTRDQPTHLVQTP